MEGERHCCGGAMRGEGEQDRTEPGRVTRREFVRQASLGAAALAAAPPLIRRAEAGAAEAPKVVAVHHQAACPVVEEYRAADPDVVRRMVKEALLKLGPGRDVGEVVRAWCPSGKSPASARVKIKFCGTRGRFPCHAEVVNGVARLLVQDGGIKPENIHVYENCPKNFGETDRPPSFGTPFGGGRNREPGVVYSQLNAPDGTDMPGSNYREDIKLELGDGKKKDFTFSYWEALEKDTDILINIPVLKRHLSTPTFTTVTGALKNHYGSIRDPYRQHGFNICEKIAAVNLARPIREKQKLVIVDALYAMYTAGPERGKIKYGLNQLLVTRDPVAADYVSWGMLNALEKCAEPREIALAARNGAGVRGARWEDHVVKLELDS